MHRNSCQWWWWQNVAVEMEEYSPRDKVALYMRAFDLARTTVEMVAFAKGWAVTIVMSEFVDPEGAVTPIFLANDKLASICTSFDLQSGFEEMLGIVLNDLAILPGIYKRRKHGARVVTGKYAVPISAFSLGVDHVAV